MEDCIFCKIIKHEIPATIRFEDDEFLAFNDINPSAKEDILLIPKKHIPSLLEFEEKDADLAGKFLLAAKNIAQKEGLKSFRLVINSGEDAGQVVNHVHAHILGGNKLGPIA